MRPARGKPGHLTVQMHLLGGISMINTIRTLAPPTIAAFTVFSVFAVLLVLATEGVGLVEWFE